jgi:exopolyphosphatase/guanosine-5'-triphosphate,3'-diphosphate pyrophosphatase
MIEFADRIECHGAGVEVVAAVEVGAEVALPFEIGRAEAEDVFRTLATESRADRALNPGLPAHMVHDVLATAIVLVSVLRFTQQPSLWLVAQ